MSEPREPEADKSCRVYVVHHDDGAITGILMRQWNVFFDRPPPSGYGRSIDDVLAQIDRELAQRAAAGDDPLERYLWSETFQMRSVTIEVRPQTFVDKRPVIGARAFPLTLQFAACQLRGGAWRVGLPRFGWWMVLESLDLAKDALETAIGAALLGEQERMVFEFRRDGREHVREWTSRLVDLEKRRHAADVDADLASRYPVMTQVADDLVSRARARRLTGMHGTLPLHIDYRVDNPWPTVLVGPRGVGKSVRVRQLAKLLAAKKRLEGEPERRLWHTTRDRILAGQMYLGMWEERVFKMAEELRRDGDWLYVERLWELLEPVGGRSGGSIGELLLPLVEAHEVNFITEATEEELARLGRRHPRWWDALSSQWISPPDEPSMAGWIPSFAQAQELDAGRARAAPWDRAAIRRLLQLQARFEPSLAQPGAAARFVDWWVRTTPPAPEVDADEITRAYASYSGLPVDMIDARRALSATRLQAQLEARVVGQPAAAEVASRVIARFEAGLSDPARPIATLLFVGPTGVGKTELAKAMCKVMFGDEARMIRLDMSEYHLPWSAERLFQIGRGVTSLAEKVRQQPMSLVLLDEIEKAHPSIFDTLMAVLDEGRLVDQRGEVVDFRMTLVVMTSNLGAGGPRPSGFATGMGLAAGADHLGAARRWFRPELLNRIDHVVPFTPLARASIDKIVALEVTKIVAREGLTRRGLKLTVGAALLAHLADEGYHPEYGARALRRALEDRLVVPLAALVAAHPELRDLRIVADLRAGEVVFDTPTAPA